MFAVIFEVKPKADRMDAYLAIARALRPELEQTEGFVSNERFASRRRPGWLLSLSLWRDEKSLIRWRAEGEHHRAQAKGRADIFADYHLRVGEVAADSQMPSGEKPDARRFDETETGVAKSLVLVERRFPGAELPPDDPAALAAGFGLAIEEAAGGVAAGLVEWDVLESIVAPGKFLLLAARYGAEAPLGPGMTGDAAVRRREVRVIRDYGMFERREAPQYYPPVPRSG